MKIADSKGQTGAWEGIIILILLIVLGGLVYLLYSKKSESTVYQADSKPKVTDIAPHPSFGGCVSVKVMEYMESKNAKPAAK